MTADLHALLERFYGRPSHPVSMKTLKGDASGRRYHRLVMPEGFSPRSVVVMELPDDPFRSDEIMSGPRPTALPFVAVARSLTARGVRSPAVYLDAAADGAVLLEDLGDRTLGSIVSHADLETVTRWYEAATDFAARMHEAMTPMPGDGLIGSRRFDAGMLRWELEHFSEYGLESRQGRPLDPAIRKRLDHAFDALTEEIASLPSGFVHRDYQSRNLMVLGDEPGAESLAVIDFQDALTGPRIYDLASLLNDSYVDVPTEIQDRMADRYASLRGPDPAQVRQELHLVSVHRKCKDTGRFVFIDRVKKNPSFLPYVEGSLARIRKNLDRLHGHDDLKQALALADLEYFG